MNFFLGHHRNMMNRHNYAYFAYLHTLGSSCCPSPLPPLLFHINLVSSFSHPCLSVPLPLSSPSHRSKEQARSTELLTLNFFFIFSLKNLQNPKSSSYLCTRKRKMLATFSVSMQVCKVCTSVRVNCFAVRTDTRCRSSGEGRRGRWGC